MSLRARVKELEAEVESLKDQLTKPLVEKEVNDWRANSYFNYMVTYLPPRKVVHELTIEGKVNMILDHLGLELEVQQRETTTTGPKIKATVKKPTKKGKK